MAILGDCTWEPATAIFYSGFEVHGRIATDQKDRPPGMNSALPGSRRKKIAGISPLTMAPGAGPRSEGLWALWPYRWIA